MLNFIGHTHFDGRISSKRHLDWLAPRLPAWTKRAVKAYTAATSAARCLPDFLILGARRCGTTSLYNYLARHPHVMPAMTKEIFFFRERFDQGLPWYRGHFPTVWEKRLWATVRGQPILTGEATPSYMYDVGAAERVRRVLPGVKLIATVRDPAEAVYSSYRFGLKFGSITRQGRPFDRLVDEELQHLAAIDPAQERRGLLAARARLELGRYLYREQLAFWGDLFGSDRLLVVVFEDLRSDPAGTMDRVHEFLGLPPFRLANYPRHNAAGHVSPLEDAPRRRLDAFFAPYNGEFAAYLGQALPWGQGG